MVQLFTTFCKRIFLFPVETDLSLNFLTAIEMAYAAHIIPDDEVTESAGMMLGVT